MSDTNETKQAPSVEAGARDDDAGFAAWAAQRFPNKYLSRTADSKSINEAREFAREGWQARAALARASEAAAGEPVAWMLKQGDYLEPSLLPLEDEALARGWTQRPLVYAAPQPAQAAGEPVATLHDDGHWTWKKGTPPHESNYAGWRMDVYATAQPATVPEGWKLVPVEPTDAMTFVGQKHRHDTVWSIGAIYREMLAAAPQAAAPADPLCPNGEPWNPNPDGIQPGDEGSPRMSRETGMWEDVSDDDAPAQPASEQQAEAAPSTLSVQIKKARDEVATWSPERRAKVRLQGSSLFVGEQQAARELSDEQQSALLKVLELADREERHRTNQAWLNLRESIASARVILAAKGDGHE